MKTKKGRDENIPSESRDPESSGFFSKYGANLVLAGLVIYVVLLAIGVFAEVFKIQSILDWWIWRPVGK